MVSLASLNGASLVPNLQPSVQNLVSAFGTKQERDAAAEVEATKQATQEQVGILTDPNRVAGSKRQQNALLRLTTLNPQAAKGISAVLESGDQRQIDEAKRQAQNGLRDATFVSTDKSGKPRDFASKQRALTSLAAQAQARGEPLDRFVQLQNLGEDELNLELERMKIMGRDIDELTKTATGDFAKAPGVLTRAPDGTVNFSIPVLDKSTGTFTNQVVPIAGEVVGKLGETAIEERLLDAGAAGLTKTNQLVAELQVKPKIETAVKGAAGAEARIQEKIDKGLPAADTLPILNRSIELLDAVKTGGIDAVSLRAKQLFGVEGADEAELSANLGKTVLSQLRETFGAAFTEKEGQRLATIEAGFGKSVAGNRRLLEQTKRLAERVANRAIKAAVKRGDNDTADEIRDAMAFSLSEPDAAAPAETAPTAGPAEGTTATNPATGQTIVFRNGQWLPQ